MPDRGPVDPVEPLLDPRQRADEHEPDREQQDRLGAQQLPDVAARWAPRRAARRSRGRPGRRRGRRSSPARPRGRRICRARRRPYRGSGVALELAPGSRGDRRRRHPQRCDLPSEGRGVLGPVGEKSGDEAAVGADVAGREGVGCTVERDLGPSGSSPPTCCRRSPNWSDQKYGLVERLAVPEDRAGDGGSLRGGARPVLDAGGAGRAMAATRPRRRRRRRRRAAPSARSASVAYRRRPSSSPAGSAPTATSAMSQASSAPSESWSTVRAAAEAGPDALDARLDSEVDAVGAIAVGEQEADLAPSSRSNGSRPASSSVTSTPSAAAVEATSVPTKPAPTTTSRAAGGEPARRRSRVGEGAQAVDARAARGARAGGVRGRRWRARARPSGSARRWSRPSARGGRGRGRGCRGGARSRARPRTIGDGARGRSRAGE